MQKSGGKGSIKVQFDEYSRLWITRLHEGWKKTIKICYEKWSALKSGVLPVLKMQS